MAVGGCDEWYKPTSAIHKYNPTTSSWNLISNMPTARFGCLVTVLPTNEMMVVDGNIAAGCAIDSVEIATIFLS